MKTAILGDVGQPVYHVGDEAMTHAAVGELRARGLHDMVVLTRNVELSRADFAVDAFPTVAFPWPPHERAEYLRRILALVEDGESDELAPSDPARALIEELRRCDALLVAGGGNMNSLYGWLLYERVAAVRIARTLGLCVVVSGQTLGPDLHGPDRNAARLLLEAADLIGARESSSLQVMDALLPGSSAVHLCLDDASFMAPDGSIAVPGRGIDVGDGGPLVPQGPYIVATFSPGHGESDPETYFSALGSVLDGAAELTGLPVVFLSHMATPAAAHVVLDGRATPGAHDVDVDDRVHTEIAARMRSENRIVVPITDAHRTAQLTREAALVITSRYHPVIFALDGSVPVIALAPDTYSNVRIKGALENWGLGSLVLPLPALFDGTFADAVSDVWSRRDDVSAYLAERRPALLLQHEQWWDTIASVLQGGSASQVSAETTVPAPPAFDAAWQDRSAISARLFFATASALTATRVELEHVRGELITETREKDRARSELDLWWNSRSFTLARRISSVASVVRRRK